MKYLLVFLVLFLCSCRGNTESNKNNLPLEVAKFKDGNVTCYTFYQGGISCIVDNNVCKSKEAK